MAFVDMGDQFIALSEGRTQPPDRHRHFGLVVDDKDGCSGRPRAGGRRDPGAGAASTSATPGATSIQIVQYDEIQFIKARCRAGRDGARAPKTERALVELRAKGVDVG